MHTAEALRILKHLADGRDPVSGDALPATSPYQHADVTRALFRAIEALERFDSREGRERALPDQAGEPWTAEEDKQLCDAYDTGTTVAQLAEIHHRTRGAIKSRLEKKGKIRQD